MRKRMLWIPAGLMALALLYPFQTTVVPAWTIRVVCENGVPVAREFVRQGWAHYTLESDSHTEDGWTDEAGYVTFPERTIRAGLLKRGVYAVWAKAMTLAHGSYGPSAEIIAWDAQRMPHSVNYKPGEPLSKEIMMSCGK
ncbi:MAG TPA: hypothetical protein VIT88_08370 [Pyrinomonadaceae bacterium]